MFFHLYLWFLIYYMALERLRFPLGILCVYSHEVMITTGSFGLVFRDLVLGKLCVYPGVFSEVLLACVSKLVCLKEVCVQHPSGITREHMHYHW